MRSIPAVFALVCAALTASGQQPTLAAALKQLGIPQTSFTHAELNQPIVWMTGKDGATTYMIYLPGEEHSADDAAPRLVRFDPGAGTVLRNNLNAKDIESCCGTAPLDITFTHNYLLASFHLNPSASIVLVADKQLKYKTVLYGFDFHQVAPDRVVYVEDQVHFAPQHPSRLALTDLRTGQQQELYPSKNDPLRAAFAALHQQHMPSQADCRKANDPCDPAIYDEDIEFVDGAAGKQPGVFQFRVTRTAPHPWVTGDAVVNVPFAVATYTFASTPAGWMYCAAEDSPARMIKSTDDPAPPGKAKSCTPNLPVLSEAPGPFTPRYQEKK